MLFRSIPVEVDAPAPSTKVFLFIYLFFLEHYKHKHDVHINSNRFPLLFFFLNHSFSFQHGSLQLVPYPYGWYFSLNRQSALSPLQCNPCIFLVVQLPVPHMRRLLPFARSFFVPPRVCFGRPPLVCGEVLLTLLIYICVFSFV